jgi:rhodanese-related sulfurtransferase
VAHHLREKGFEAYVLEGGLSAWRHSGREMEAVPPEDVMVLPKFK